MKALLLCMMFAMFAFAAEKPGWKITMEPVGKVRANYPAQVNVALRSAKDAPLDAANVESVLTMIGMDHGEFKSPAKMTQPGLYEAQPTLYGG